MFATIPFHDKSNVSAIRAKLDGNELKHLLSPMFHGNPVSAEGSLVFTDFGWDILDALKNAGFVKTIIEVYADARHGHLGGGQLIFKSFK